MRASQTRKKRAASGAPCPPFPQVVLDSEVIENPRDDEIHRVFYFLRTIVKAGGGRHYYCSRTREPKHVAEMNRAQRSLPRDQDEFPALLERHVCRALDQRTRCPDAHRTQRSHRTGADHHPLSGTRAGRRRTSAVVVPESRDEFVPGFCSDLLSKLADRADVRFGREQPQSVT